MSCQVNVLDTYGVISFQDGLGVTPNRTGKRVQIIAYTF